MKVWPKRLKTRSAKFEHKSVSCIILVVTLDVDEIVLFNH